MRDSEALNIGERRPPNLWLSVLTVHRGHLGSVFKIWMPETHVDLRILIQLHQGLFWPLDF